MDSVLEREKAPVQEMSAEEREHREKMSERMRALLSGSDLSFGDGAASAAHTVVEQPQAAVFSYPRERRAPAENSSPAAGTKRLTDFYGSEGRTMQRLTDTYAANVKDYAPPAEHDLFGGILDKSVQASVYTPTAPEREPEPISMPMTETYGSGTEYETSALGEEDEDAVPTRRTMLHRNVAQTQEETRLLSALSLKTKLVLAAVAAVVVLLLAVVCINTAIINSIDRAAEERTTRLTQLTETMESIDSEIGELTSPEYVEAWAAEHGMLG